ncbi:hypothetical protein [Acidimangrovimonas pyrenivorans]|uniref:SGNH/GDSL hydrolase family protein n=1 Tax=Acidimangrovimonas pyrenivorans TaxID=2030798 RepID=A0ABV7ABZ1_9RHOB
MKLFIGGNSHTPALKYGLDALGQGAHEIHVGPFGTAAKVVKPFSAIRKGVVEFTLPEYAANLERFTGKRHFDPADLWGICMGTHFARIYRNPFWKEAAPAALAGPGRRPASRPASRPVSRAVLDAMIRNDQRHVRALLSQLKKTGVRFFVIECPPPRREWSTREPCIPVDVLAAVDGAARKQFRAWLARRDLPLVENPPEVVGPDGLLKDAYAKQVVLSDGQPDRLHANAEYGRLMMERIVAQIESMAATA